MRITFANQKGGTGKSTVLLNLAALLVKEGYDVAIDDRDHQQTSGFFAPQFGVPLAKENPGAEYILTDTPGHLETSQLPKLRPTFKESDRIILVALKSPASIHASAPMAQFINRFKPKNTKAYTLFNLVRAQTIIGSQKARDLAKQLGLEALKNELPQAQPYENAYVQGLSAVTGEHRTFLYKLALEILK